VAIHLSGLPGDCPFWGGGPPCPLLGLAPGGVCRASRVAPAPGALLPHRFTLACARKSGPSAVCSLWHFPSSRPDWPLASTVALRSPDLPRRRGRDLSTAATWPTHRRHQSASPLVPRREGFGVCAYRRVRMSRILAICWRRVPSDHPHPTFPRRPKKLRPGVPRWGCPDRERDRPGDWEGVLGSSGPGRTWELTWHKRHKLCHASSAILVLCGR